MPYLVHALAHDHFADADDVRVREREQHVGLPKSSYGEPILVRRILPDTILASRMSNRIRLLSSFLQLLSL